MQLNRLLLLTLSVLTAFLAKAQNPNDLKDEVLISIDVGYNSAYRANSWVPVDVLVINEQDDLKGYVEVRSYDGVGSLMSPVYRLAVQCPRDSKKRFRLYAYMLKNTARVEGLLFEKGRLAVDAPAYIKVRPIRDDSLMVLLLDNDRLNYGFLFTTAQQHRIHMHHILEYRRVRNLYRIARVGSPEAWAIHCARCASGRDSDSHGPVPCGPFGAGIFCGCQ